MGSLDLAQLGPLWLEHDLVRELQDAYPFFLAISICSVKTSGQSIFVLCPTCRKLLATAQRGRIGWVGPSTADAQDSRDLLEVVLTHLLVAGISTHTLDASIGKVLTWIKEL